MIDGAKQLIFYAVKISKSRSLFLPNDLRATDSKYGESNDSSEN